MLPSCWKTISISQKRFLLGIGEYVTCPHSWNDEGYKHSSDSSTLFGIPIKLCGMPDCDIQKRKRRYRKRGRRGGYRVHLKRLLFGLKEPADFITSLGFNLQNHYGRTCESEPGLPCMDRGSLGGECCGSGCFIGKVVIAWPYLSKVLLFRLCLSYPTESEASISAFETWLEAERGKLRESSTPH